MDMGFLGKQVGPLPAGAWIAVVGGGLAIGWYFSKGSAEANKSAAAVPLTEPGVGTGGGGQLIYDPPTNVEAPSNAVTTNEQWANRAINWLISSKGMNPGIAQAAITKFLTGQNRDIVEQGMINLALMEYGAPPEQVPLPEAPIPTPQPPVTPPKPVPTKPRSWNFYTVQRGDTPGKIVSKTKSASWWAIYWANDRVGLRPDGTPGVLAHPYALKPGQVLLIPTRESGMVTSIPKAKAGLPARYHTVTRGESIDSIAKRYKIHPWNLYIANDVVGPRPDGSRGILLAFSVKPGQRLVVPYQ